MLVWGVAIFSLLFLIVIGGMSFKNRYKLKSKDKDDRDEIKIEIRISIVLAVLLVVSIVILVSFTKTSYQVKEKTAEYKIATEFQYSDSNSDDFKFITIDKDGNPQKITANLADSKLQYVKGIEPYAVEYTTYTRNTREGELWYDFWMIGGDDDGRKTYEIFLPKKE